MHTAPRAATAWKAIARTAWTVKLAKSSEDIDATRQRASRIAERLSAQAPFTIEEIDITRDDALHARYLERIPVVALDDLRESVATEEHFELAADRLQFAW